MISLEKKPGELPTGLVLEEPPFVPRLVMTTQMKVVVREVVSQWRHRDKFAGLVKYGIRPLDRLLFYGPPGNGKTMACYWIARELSVPVYRVLCNQLHSQYVSETTKNMAAVLDFLNGLTKPTICLWDEVESIFIDRKKSRGFGGDREMATATGVMLQALDRWRSPALLVMATNMVENLDTALKSRIEMQLLFPAPTHEQCESMLAYWMELLSDHGAAEWGKALSDRIIDQTPESFRELQQRIAHAAREWTAAQIK